MGSTANKGIGKCICETEKAGKGARKDGLCACVCVCHAWGGRWSELRCGWRKSLHTQGGCEGPETQSLGLGHRYTTRRGRRKSSVGGRQIESGAQGGS